MVRLSSATFLVVVGLLVRHCLSEDNANDDEPELDADFEVSEGDDDGDSMEAPDPVELTPSVLSVLHGRFDLNRDGKASFLELLDYNRLMQHKLANESAQTILQEADLNKDGKLSLSELQQDLAEDGIEDDKEAEFAEQRNALVDEEFKLADKNGDKFLDVQELQAVYFPGLHEGITKLNAGATLKVQDADFDGQLSLSEFLQPSQGMSDDELSDLHDSHRHLDKDGSGFLSQEELEPWATGSFEEEAQLYRWFHLVDEDKDDHLTVDELRDAHASNLFSHDAQQKLQSWHSLQEL
eukprot:gnl/MRDRNA2_/MRDRNA2_30391_c0_seq1.p1 gnl/MRDRNA2_/MRDRNA2_30391_c0~~gnl/MRDRNA2_/MRDRNA2_30391_c0_seq1.p1  ORF type:complete len:296 (-),score=86.98 gnl/MRDRNA2_/MRDRNA2_30391_c0_seq1:70-957(-)